MVEKYPKPSEPGGRLIRKIVASFRENGIELPLKKNILIATSGGVDSMCLAHVLSVYGRRIVSKGQITLLHFDHRWRTESGTIERQAIESFAQELGVDFQSVQLKTQAEKALSRNREDDARRKRNEFYHRVTAKRQTHGYVLTAHHADDVVETLVWRFFRGELHLQSEGILFNDNNVLRPLLKVFKEDLYAYARAEKVPYFEDPTNADSSQMRAFFRTELKPLLLKHFPGFRNSVLSYTAALKKSRTRTS